MRTISKELTDYCKRNMSELQKLAVEVGGEFFVEPGTEVGCVRIQLDDKFLFVYGNDRKHIVRWMNTPAHSPNEYPVNWIEAHRTLMELWYRKESVRKLEASRSKQEKALEVGLTVAEYEVMMSWKNDIWNVK